MTGPRTASKTLLQALTTLARAKHSTDTCYASFSKMRCQYKSILPVAKHSQSSPSSLLNKHQQHDKCLLLVVLKLGPGVWVGWVWITDRTRLPDCKQESGVNLYLGWQNPAQITPDLHHHRKLTQYFPLTDFSFIT